MNDIKVSIIVPSYKRTKEMYARAIESLLQQSYENIEIVVVDDNAKPEHIEYRVELASYITELNNDKIKYIQNVENLGGALSRNAGIEVATGEYITFLDDDDRYLIDKVKNQLTFILDRNVDMVFGDIVIHNEKDELIDYRNHSTLKSFEHSYILKYHLTKQIAGTPSFMMKKEVLEDINGFEAVRMGQEYFLMMKIINSGASIAYMSQCDFVAYRTSAEAISTGKNKIYGEKDLYAYKKQFFKHLSLWDKSYVRCRHFAVMAVAYKRNHMYGKMSGALLLSILSNPFIVVSEVFGFLGRKQKGKKV